MIPIPIPEITGIELLFLILTILVAGLLYVSCIPGNKKGGKGEGIGKNPKRERR